VFACVCVCIMCGCVCVYVQVKTTTILYRHPRARTHTTHTHSTHVHTPEDGGAREVIKDRLILLPRRNQGLGKLGQLPRQPRLCVCARMRVCVRETCVCARPRLRHRLLTLCPPALGQLAALTPAT